MSIYKSWLLKVLFTSLIVIGPILGSIMYYNYQIDPLWNFNHENEYNDLQIGFDERQQKTNYIMARPFNYDSLLVGSSRVTYMNQSKFKDDHVFNYSLSDMHIDEFSPYINFAKDRKGSSFDKIYMELYFESFRIGTNPYKEPSVFFENTTNPFYRYTTLFSYNTLERSSTNKELSLANYYSGFRSYNRSNIGTTSYVNDNMEAALKKYSQSFEKNKKTEKYPYDDSYKAKLHGLVDENPTTDFVVFTDPMPAEKLRTILQDKLYWSVYVRWYTEMVDVFGTVYSFQTINPYTTNLDYWFDTYHYNPSVGDVMIDQLENRNMDTSICFIVTKENINDYFSMLQEQISSTSLDPNPEK